MYALYTRPTGITWTLQGDAAFINSDGGEPLTNERPGLGARITWITGAQTTASVTELRGSWASGSVLKGIMLMGITLPVGTRVQVLGRLAGGSTFDVDLGADSRIVSRSGGDRSLVLWFTNTAALDGIAIKFFNDVDGVASISASFAFDIGELYFGEGHEIIVMGGATLTPVDTTVTNQTTTGGSTGVAGVQFWEFDAQPLFRETESIYGSMTQASPADSYRYLLTRLNRDQACVFIPSHATQALLSESAIFGKVASIGPIKHMHGSLYQPTPLKIREIPVPV